VEELKRHLKRELLGDLKPIMESQGIQFPDIAGVMSKEYCRSRIASTAVTPITTKPTNHVSAGNGRPLGELQVTVFGPVEGHEQPLPSFKPDMIDNLAQPTSCNLVVMIR
jgi:hypothetical protein